MNIRDTRARVHVARVPSFRRFVTMTARRRARIIGTNRRIELSLRLASIVPLALSLLMDPRTHTHTLFFPVDNRRAR